MEPHPLLVHARRVLAAHFAGRPWAPDSEGAGTRPSRGCFVSLKQGERLRGCIGTVLPVRPTLEQEVADNALAAATRDPRFAPLPAAELAATQLSIDLLTLPEPVDDHEALDPQCYGIIVRAGRRSGVLLPGLPGVDSVAGQLAICLDKAGIEPADRFILSRFRVERLSE